MTDDRNDFISPTARRWTRRRVLAGTGLAVSTVAVARLGSGSASAVSGELNTPGSALEPAVRVSPPTTTTTTVPPPPLGDDEILFPIIVGPDDNVVLNDNFGACRSGCSRRHEGTDIMADVGLPVRSVSVGTLTNRYVDSGKNYGAGNGWTVFDAATNITYKYFHLDHHAADLEVGDAVDIGQVIGYVGNTGTSGISSNTNHHLHFEYRPNNIPQNSYYLLQRDPNVRFV